jgi:type IV pilus assembly protein PilA
MARTLSRARPGLALAACHLQSTRKIVRTGFTLIELLLVVAIIGILAAIAIPTFTKVQARSKQSEAKANLKAVFTAQRAFYQEKSRYSALTGELGFAPERNNRYAYFLSTTVNLEDRANSAIVPQTSNTGIAVDVFKYGTAAAITSVPTSPCGASAAPKVDGPPLNTNLASFVAEAAGNVDSDPTLDIWTISSESRSLSGAGCTAEMNNPAGEPANDVNDVTL